MVRKSNNKSKTTVIPPAPPTPQARAPAPAAPQPTEHNRMGFGPFPGPPHVEDLLTADKLHELAQEWFWEPYVPRGALVGLTGGSGAGKSIFCARLIGLVTTGVPLTGNQTRPAGRCIIYSREQDPDRDTRPQLLAAGVDMGRCYLGDVLSTRNAAQVPHIPDRIDRLDQLIQRTKASLVVFDPITSYLSPGISKIDEQHVRSVQESLSVLAIKRDCTIVTILHHKKGKETNPLHKVSGNPAWTAVPRFILQLGTDPRDPTKRLLAVAKGSGGGNAPSRRYEIRGPRGGGVWTLGEPVEISAEEMGGVADDPDERTARGDAVELLKQLLESEEVPYGEVISAGKDLGISPTTMRRAKRDQGIASIHGSRGGKRCLLWKKPDSWPQ